jgi:hypothetical protein
MAEVVGNDDEITPGIERLPWTEELRSKHVSHTANEVNAVAAGAMEDEHCVADDAVAVALRLADRRVMNPHLREDVAGEKSEIPDDVVAFDRRRIVSAKRGGTDDDH